MEKHPRFTLSEFRKLINYPGKENDEFLISSHAQQNQRFFLNPTRVDAYIFLLCVKGTAKVKIDLDEYDISPQRILVTNPENIVQLVHLDDDAQFYSIVITDKSLKSLNINYQFLMDIFIILSSSNQFILMKQQFIELTKSFLYTEEKIYNYEGKMRELIIKSLLPAFFYQLYDLIKDISVEHERVNTQLYNRKETIMKGFVKLLRDHHTKERSVAFYANALTISNKHLSKVVKEISNHTVMEWADYYVILEAKNMLLHSEMSIQEIASDLNFPNQSFFSQYFKRHTTLTPLSYRNKINNNNE